MAPRSATIEAFWKWFLTKQESKLKKGENISDWQTKNTITINNIKVKESQ
jgi:hypothetical protein